MKKKIICLTMVLILAIGLLACSKTVKEDEKLNSDEKENVSTEAEIIEGDEHPYIGTKKATLKSTKKAPEIDGEKDKLYDKVGTKISLDEFNLEYWENKPLSKSAEVYLTYDKDYLYLYAEVVDDSIDDTGEEVWKRDSLGVILDFNYTREKVEYEQYQGKGIGYVNIACNNTHEYYHEYLAEPYVSMISYKSRIIERSDSKYVIEMRLPFIEEFDGGKIGFDVTNTDCINGDRCGVRTWNIDGSQMYKYTHCTGTLEFEKNLWK